MIQLMVAALLSGTLSTIATHQSKITTFGGGTGGIDARESTWIAYFDQDGGRFTGGLTVNYNKVQWQDEYAEQLETILRGERWRLGKHFWSTLDTNLDMTMGGVRVEAGYYYLGLARSDDGEAWTLLLIDSDEARKARLDAFNIADAPVAHEVPLSFARSIENAPALQMVFEVGRGEGGIAEGFVGDVEFRLHFGPYRLRAPIVVDAMGSAR